jgi:hypothetical protein
MPRQWQFESWGICHMPFNSHRMPNPELKHAIGVSLTRNSHSPGTRREVALKASSARSQSARTKGDDLSGSNESWLYMGNAFCTSLYSLQPVKSQCSGWLCYL